MGFGFVLSDPLVNHMIIEKSHAQVRARNLCYLSMAIFWGSSVILYRFYSVDGEHAGVAV